MVEDVVKLFLSIAEDYQEGIKWEYRKQPCDSDREGWEIYSLGTEINPEWDYRPIIWHVYEMSDGHFNKTTETFRMPDCCHGSEKECDEYIKKHQKKWYLEKQMDKACKRCLEDEYGLGNANPMGNSHDFWEGFQSGAEWMKYNFLDTGWHDLEKDPNDMPSEKEQQDGHVYFLVSYEKKDGKYIDPEFINYDMWVCWHRSPIAWKRVY